MKDWQRPVTNVAAGARRYGDAVKGMRGRQIAYRARRLVPMRVLAAGTAGGGRPGWRPLAAGIGVEPAPSTGPVPPPHPDGHFRAYGAVRASEDPELWRDRRDGLLFLFHLHGFQDLARYARSGPEGEGSRFWTEVIRSWLDECSRPSSPGWHPYPTSGRVIAWCAALSHEGWLGELRKPMLASLRQQLRTLGRSIEHDIGGNHVLRNGAALVIGGACLEDAPSRSRGLRLLRAELESQLLADGGHEERSPSYHRLVLADLHDVAIVLDREGSQVPDWLLEAAERMQSWIHSIAGPDGTVPPLNDGWDGPPVAVAAGRPALETLLPSGYVVLRQGDSQSVLDVGPVSPAHLPAHAHADVLSLVHWADRRPVLIDPGSGSYTGPDRDAFRGTAAHNTVEVDGEDQCDLWGTFRAAGLPRVQVDALDRKEEGVVFVRACHDGYRRLADPVFHERTFLWLGSDGIAVIDRLICEQPHEVVSRLHFAEGIDTPLATELPGRLRFSPIGAEIVPACSPGRRSPFIGSINPATVLAMRARVAPGERFGWALTRPGVNLRLHGSRLELGRPGREEIGLEMPS